MKMKTKSALSYFGSDSEVAAGLAAMLDHCNHVTIAFCGGMSILPHLKARAIVANDLHSHVINFYRVASGRMGVLDQQALLDRCEHTLSHPNELVEAQKILSDPDSSAVDRAWAFWALCWIGRKGQGGAKKQGGMPSVRWKATGGTNASRIKAAAGDLSEWVKHFERCEFQSVDFRNLLVKVADDPKCGVYCDAPWPGAGEAYLHAFQELDHRDLAEMLDRFKFATVVVRYGDHPLIRELYEGWHITETISRDQANANKGEIWITNRKAN